MALIMRFDTAGLLSLGIFKNKLECLTPKIISELSRRDYLSSTLGLESVANMDQLITMFHRILGEPSVDMLLFT